MGAGGDEGEEGLGVSPNDWEREGVITDVVEDGGLLEAVDQLVEDAVRGDVAEVPAEQLQDEELPSLKEREKRVQSSTCPQGKRKKGICIFSRHKISRFFSFYLTKFSFSRLSVLIVGKSDHATKRKEKNIHAH